MFIQQFGRAFKIIDELMIKELFIRKRMFWQCGCIRNAGLYFLDENGQQISSRSLKRIIIGFFCLLLLQIQLFTTASLWLLKRLIKLLMKAIKNNGANIVSNCLFVKLSLIHDNSGVRKFVQTIYINDLPYNLLLRIHFIFHLIRYKAINQMGNEILSTLRLDNSTSLQHHSTIRHPLYGQVKVYTYDGLPMTFIMCLNRSPTHSRLYHTFQQVQDLEHPALTTLYAFKIERKSNCNFPSRDTTIEYWQYLNYSLAQHIQDRCRRQAPFTIHEVWYLIQTVCEVGLLLQKFGLIWQVNPVQMQITPEGKLKCNWAHLESNNTHLKYYQAITENMPHTKECGDFGRRSEGIKLEVDEGEETTHDANNFLSPEEKELVTERERSCRINLEKSNSYKLGLLLANALTFKMYSTPIEPYTLKKICSELISQNYPPKFAQILQGTLEIDPRKRWTLEMVQQFGRGDFSSNYQILISEGRKSEMLGSKRENSKIIRRYINPNTESSQGAPAYTTQLRQIGSTQSNSNQRLMELRQYRRSLQCMRENNN